MKEYHTAAGGYAPSSCPRAASVGLLDYGS